MSPEQTDENAFQTYLRHIRYWETRDHKPPRPEEDIRRIWDTFSHRAWRVWLGVKRRPPPEPLTPLDHSLIGVLPQIGPKEVDRTLPYSI